MDDHQRRFDGMIRKAMIGACVFAILTPVVIFALMWATYWLVGQLSGTAR